MRPRTLHIDMCTRWAASNTYARPTMPRVHTRLMDPPYAHGRPQQLDSMAHRTCFINHTTCCMSHRTCSMHYRACSAVHITCSMQYVNSYAANREHMHTWISTKCRDGLCLPAQSIDNVCHGGLPTVHARSDLRPTYLLGVRDMTCRMYVRACMHPLRRACHIYVCMHSCVYIYIYIYIYACACVYTCPHAAYFMCLSSCCMTHTTFVAPRGTYET